MLDSRRMGPAALLLRDELRSAVVGQDEAIHEIVSLYQAWSAGMIPANRPAGKFLFLGPTGTGKTRVVEATVGSLIGNPQALIKIDCGEFQHSHEIAKLIGSPPGYLGHRETSPVLSQDRLNAQHTDKLKLSFVLFDEIEKASDALWNLLLGILDKATLTTGSNMRVDFSNTMIFMTSNVGAAEMNAILNPQTGFKVHQENRNDTPKRIATSALGAARRKFPPEFVNRADRIVVFQPLGSDELRRVLDIELKMLQRRIFETTGGKGFVFRATEAAKELLLLEGTDTKYGARPLKRAIDRLLVYPLSNLIATAQIEEGDVIRVDAAEQHLTFARTKSSAAGHAA